MARPSIPEIKPITVHLFLDHHPFAVMVFIKPLSPVNADIKLDAGN